jgi:hypothetical protein
MVVAETVALVSVTVAIVSVTAAPLSGENSNEPSDANFSSQKSLRPAPKVEEVPATIDRDEEVPQIQGLKNGP